MTSSLPELVNLCSDDEMDGMRTPPRRLRRLRRWSPLQNILQRPTLRSVRRRLVFPSPVRSEDSSSSRSASSTPSCAAPPSSPLDLRMHRSPLCPASRPVSPLDNFLESTETLPRTPTPDSPDPLVRRRPRSPWDSDDSTPLPSPRSMLMDLLNLPASSFASTEGTSWTFLDRRSPRPTSQPRVPSPPDLFPSVRRPADAPPPYRSPTPTFMASFDEIVFLNRNNGERIVYRRVTDD